MKSDRHKRDLPPLQVPDLERLALFYAGRYAATRAKLRAYLARKLRERGWGGEGEPPVERLVERFAELGYVDDRAFAAARAEAMGRRGYGERRVGQALRAAGIEEEDSAAARAQAREDAWSSALRFAERRRIGPFAGEAAERPAREKALAAMLRAGHPLDLARRLVNASPGEIPPSGE
ncbi:MAG TPA: RecX family transcriptional regulator [Allosphingosinicella sp.]